MTAQLYLYFYFIQACAVLSMFRCFDPMFHVMQVPKVCHVERVVEVPQVQVQEAVVLHQLPSW